MYVQCINPIMHKFNIGTDMQELIVIGMRAVMFSNFVIVFRGNPDTRSLSLIHRIRLRRGAA